MRERLGKLTGKAIRDTITTVRDTDILRVGCGKYSLLTDERQAKMDEIWDRTFNTGSLKIYDSIEIIFMAKFVEATINLESIYLRHKLRKIQKAEEA